MSSTISSLTSIFSFPTECATATEQWLGPWDEIGHKCSLLTDSYYSPAICPNGYTAAFTGPSAAPGETAMFCCPLGMSSMPGAGCDGYCVSASLSSNSHSPFATIYNEKVRDAIEIRWQSSDLAVLVTHPLTPGLTLNPPASTLPPIAPLEPVYKLAVGLAFLPVIVAGVAAIWGALLVHRKRRRLLKTKVYAAPSNSVPESFRPKSLTVPPLMFFFGFAVSAIILLEISCHILPSTSGSIYLPKMQSRDQVTKIIRTDLTLLKSALEGISTVDNNLSNITCTDYNYSEPKYTVSTVIEDIPGTITIFTHSIPVPTCSISGIPVEHDCERPVGAPPGRKWLKPNNTSGNNSSAWKAAYFLATIFPTLLATIFAVPWKIINAHAVSLEPFHKISQQNGSPMATSILKSYEGINSLHALLPCLTVCIMYTTSIIPSLASEAWKLGLIGKCAADESTGCSAILQVVPQVVRSLEAVLALVAFLIIFLAIRLRSWSTGVVADPRSILGIASLSHNPDLLQTIASIPNSMLIKDIRRWAGTITLWVTPSHENGIILSGIVDDHFRSATKARPSRNSVSGTINFLVIFAFCITGFDALIIYYRLTGGNTSFERFMSSQSFGPRFVFSLAGTGVCFGWGKIFKVTTLLTPYLNMVPALQNLNYSRKARSSIFLPYATDPYTSLLSTFRLSYKHDHFSLLSLVTLNTILSDFLPLLLSAVPFSRTTTFNSHVVCSWLSVAILTFMVIVIIFLIRMLKSPSMAILCKDEGFDMELLKDFPIFGILRILSRQGSEGFMGSLKGIEGLERMSTRERDGVVEGLGGRYCLVGGTVHVQIPEILVVERIVVEGK